MTLDEFAARHGTAPPPERRSLQEIDAEIAAMVRDLPPIGSWDEVPEGGWVFVLWVGGNRGMYVRRGDALYIDRYLVGPLFRLPSDPASPQRWEHIAWTRS